MIESLTNTTQLQLSLQWHISHTMYESSLGIHGKTKFLYNPTITIVGLPEAEVKEARDRVRAAIQNSRFDFPVSRITVNLAPADLPKESGRYDLPIALEILAASGQIPAASLRDYEFAGELALTG